MVTGRLYLFPSEVQLLTETAVLIWNRININSQLGQTDFNTITPIGYTDVSVRTGGGSEVFIVVQL
jgi:iron complex outermembrane receptor protein